MKRILPLFLALLLIPALAACDSGGDDGDDNGNGTGGGITATVDGAGFNPDTVNPTFDSGVLQVTGIRGTMDQLTVAVPSAATGTFSVGSGNSASIIYREGTNVFNANGVMGSGTITIDELSDSGASGTFSGTLAGVTGGTVSVTNGSFDVSF